jgi:hypothetical protein
VRLLDAYDLTVLDRVDVRSLALVYHEYFSALLPAPAPTIGAAVDASGRPKSILCMCFESALRAGNTSDGCGWDPQLLLLGNDGVLHVKVQQWSNQLSQRTDRGEWLEALGQALDMYEGDGRALIGLPRTLTVLQNTLRPHFTSLLTTYVDAALEHVQHRKLTPAELAVRSFSIISLLVLHYALPYL